MTTSSARVAIYTRVSTTEQDTAMQEQELRLEAERRGWRVVGVWTDHGVSGAQERRPGLDELLQRLEQGRGIDVLFVWKLDRLARSVRQLLDITSRLTGLGIGFASLRDPHVDTTTAAGRFSLQILGAVAELERELVRERVVAGVRRAQAAGKHCGRQPVEVDLRPALAMLEKGHGLKTTARALGVSRSTLRRRLLDADEWPRSPVTPTSEHAS
jgi:DNA invertase Pin-like site-specific DNA recombinase